MRNPIFNINCFQIILLCVPLTVLSVRINEYGVGKGFSASAPVVYEIPQKHFNSKLNYGSNTLQAHHVKNQNKFQSSSIPIYHNPHPSPIIFATSQTLGPSPVGAKFSSNLSYSKPHQAQLPKLVSLSNFIKMPTTPTPSTTEAMYIRGGMDFVYPSNNTLQASHIFPPMNMQGGEGVDYYDSSEYAENRQDGKDDGEEEEDGDEEAEKKEESSNEESKTSTEDDTKHNGVALFGTDFQPGRMVNIFFGLFLIIFMLVIQGFFMWVIGIAFLPGTRAFQSEWMLNVDRAEEIIQVVLDALDPGSWDNSL